MTEEYINNKFIEYTSNYEKSGRIKLKIEHILRVAKNCKKIAQSLNLSDDDVMLSYLIGICHDIGRFEQVKRFNTFSDKDSKLDHAEYSNYILFEQGLINEFNPNINNYNIIKKAVKNHNKLNIEEGLTERELMFAKIIRDADKLDILYLIHIENKEDIYWYNDFSCTKLNYKLFEDILDYKLINYKDIYNNADQIITFYNYSYDLYFKESYKIILDNKYYEKYLEKVKDTFEASVYEKIYLIHIYVLNYINKKIKSTN